MQLRQLGSLLSLDVFIGLVCLGYGCLLGWGFWSFSGEGYGVVSVWGLVVGCLELWVWSVWICWCGV